MTGNYTYSVLNTQWAGGADPSGTNDSTAAFQAALNALAAAGGGLLYIPAGSYLITSTLTWTSASSLSIAGDGEDASQINRASATAPFHTFDIRNVTGGVLVADLNILNSVSAASFADDQVGLYFGACMRVRLENVHINASTNRVNIAVEIDDCNTTSILACDLRGYVNAVYITNGSAVQDIVATALFTNSGSGQPLPGAVAVNGTTGTLHMTNVVTNGGEHGLIASGTGSHPSFFFLHDVEVNNTAGHGIYLETGSQFWGNQLWLSDQTVPYPSGVYHGIYFGSGYTGWAVIDNSTFQHWPGHGVFIDGGQSYWIGNSSFSGCSGNSAGTYDDINVAAPVSELTIIGNHFDVEPFNNMAPPRSGVYLTSGVSGYSVTGNTFAPSGYGTAACVDGNTVPQRNGFKSNVHGFDYKDAASAAAIPAISTTETVVVKLQTDPNDLLENAVYRFRIVGQYTNGSAGATNNLRARVGTTGSTSDTQIANFTNTSDGSAGSSANVDIDGLIQLLSPGSSGSGKGWAKSVQSGAGYGPETIVFFTPDVTSWNTATSTWLTLTFGTSDAANTLAVTMATLEKVV